MQTKSLKDISAILSGYTLRGSLNKIPKGETGVILAQHLNDDGSLNQDDLPRLDIDSSKTSASVRRNDVLLSCRGIFKAGAVKDLSGETIASSSLYVIRPNLKIVLPEFLSIFLNSRAGQQQIRQHLTGSSIKTLLRKSVESLCVPLPSLEVQKQIVELQSNWVKQEHLLHQKIYLGRNVAEGAIQYLLTL